MAALPRYRNRLSQGAQKRNGGKLRGGRWVLLGAAVI